MIGSTVRRLVLVAALLATALTAPPAHAQSAPRAADYVTFFSTNMGLWNLRTRQRIITCQEHEMVGWPTFNAVNLETEAFTNCTDSLNFSLNAQATGIWKYKTLTSYPPSSLTTISITQISLHFSGVSCSITVTGGSPGIYDSAGAAMALAALQPNPDKVTLIASGVVSCFGLVTNGDLLEWRGDYTVDPPL
ncbi:hypothetical protein [Actinomadura rugatobispora]|uniref:Secreted protein n=1 Tax=Actinomadura rugatobispora TaxID=1994 RepID=A0ABW1A0W1_9ACTN|nr:hypothetical protein GCM10010200_014410 [Actinomadura rugatobispora]